MQIRQSSGFEAALEAELNQLDARFEANEALHATRKEVDKKADIGPTKPHQFWTKGAPYIEGVLGEFARDRVVHLTNADFAHGTLRVLVPCKLVLCESIVFNPNGGVPENSRKIDRQRDAAHDWFPHSQQPAYVVNRGTHSQAT